MPAVQQGTVYAIAGRRYGIRYVDAQGVRRRKSPFDTKKAARQWYRDHVEPTLLGETPALEPLTLREFNEVFLRRHGAQVRSRTKATLTERLRSTNDRFGDVKLVELERMVDEIADWASQQPAGVRHHRVAALRQALAAAQRWGHISSNPAAGIGRNRKPPPREIRAFTPEELRALSEELATAYRAIPYLAAATGLRPEEWMVLERRDIDRRARVLTVSRTVSDGEVVPLAKTSRSRRQVPLTARALEALELVPARLDVPLLFPAPRGGVLNIDNWRRRVWAPAVDAAGVPKPARIYDLRSTFATNAIAAGIGLHPLARVMGTSVGQLEERYVTLLDGHGEHFASRLDDFDRRRGEETTNENQEALWP